MTVRARLPHSTPVLGQGPGPHLRVKTSAAISIISVYSDLYLGDRDGKRGAVIIALPGEASRTSMWAEEASNQCQEMVPRAGRD